MEGVGAVEWTRTTDLLITNQLLYQLSYNSPYRSVEGYRRTLDKKTLNYTAR
jgi:hypothetical protein